MALLIKVFTLLFLAFTAPGCSKNIGSNNNPPPGSPRSLEIEVLAKDLQFPWGLAYLPNGDLLFTERPGKLSILKEGASAPAALASRQVQQNGEGGLLGLAVDPQYSDNHFIYLYETTDSNRVLRFRLENGQLSDEKVIVPGMPKAQNHDGGVIRFGPDGYLYVGTGDALQRDLAQDKNSMAGKILRVDRDGKAAPGNPYGTRVWSYGHRNVQGLAFAPSGQLYATEHGPSGENGWCCHDELNLVTPGANYGWPLALGGTEKDGLVPPVSHSGSDTWAPSGCVYTGKDGVWPGTLVVACLRGTRLLRFSLGKTGKWTGQRSDTLENTFGRLRNIITGPGGSLVFCTSNGNDQVYSLRYR